jgi:hypothetical protein
VAVTPLAGSTADRELGIAPLTLPRRISLSPIIRTRQWLSIRRLTEVVVTLVSEIGRLLK